MRCMLEKKRRSSLIPIFTSRDSMISVFSRFGASSTNERTASFFFPKFAFTSNKSKFVSVHNEELVVGSDRLNSSWKTLPSQHFFQARNYYLGYDTSKMGSSINHQHIINHHTNQPSTRLTQKWWHSSDRKHPEHASDFFDGFVRFVVPKVFWGGERSQIGTR